RYYEPRRRINIDTTLHSRFIRMDLLNPIYANLFQFLTVTDPTEYGADPNETRVKGRINVNTAPWFVIAQLPWMEPKVAQALVSFRDTFGAFDTIGDLIQVPEMAYYAIDPAFKDVDLDRWPDFTPLDGAISDFEERDLIFSRISNLITVRSDVFTAYILVRIGLDGPQKRVIAILDRSRVATPTDKVRLLNLQLVPDPR
ncbi:MAG: helix-hairpin-helix domain-containing protein, partial [Sedimentisphaerales bacterium]